MDRSLNILFTRMLQYKPFSVTMDTFFPSWLKALSDTNLLVYYSSTMEPSIKTDVGSDNAVADDFWDFYTG